MGNKNKNNNVETWFFLGDIRTICKMTNRNL